ncbi:MAG: divergent polysaccharide deacetylase family protein [Alphaproteobacteria bacterium]|nr:divergent polysaccharide deacetylase family protein [Alphaproteobacteria bacterium]
MQRNKKLLTAWIIFGVCVISFMLITKIYYDSQNERDFSYQYRIIVDENIKTENEINDNNNFAKKSNSEEKTEVITSTANQSTNSIDVKNESSEEELYEKLGCGNVPKISPDGVRVLDAFAAKYQDNEKQKKIYLIILLNSDTTATDLSKIMPKLRDNKITFVIPQYTKELSQIVEVIKTSGHEFFLQIPTQTSVPSSKQGVVSPFLANMNSEDLINKLYELLASTKWAIGLANTTSTLLTKSSKDMSIIVDELSKRGLAFLDLEKSNDVIKKISEENSEFAYINAPEIFQNKSEKIDVSNNFANKNVISVFINDLPAFMTEFSKQKEFILAPVSAILKR